MLLYTNVKYHLLSQILLPFSISASPDFYTTHLDNDIGSA